MNELFISIQEASDGGYFYDIYDRDPADQPELDSLAGGQCTTTLSAALEMAYDEAAKLIR